VLLLILGQLLVSWSFQSRLGIITTTIISCLPQIGHLIGIFLVTIALYSCLLPLILGPRAAAASSYGSAWYEMLMGLLGGPSLVLPGFFPEGVAQSRAEALAVGLIYYSREFIFIMILMQFFMTTIGGVFFRVKAAVMERLAALHGQRALGAWVGLRYLSPPGLAAGGIPWDVSHHVMPEFVGVAREALEKLTGSSTSAGGVGGTGSGGPRRGRLRELRSAAASSSGSREASSAGLLQGSGQVPATRREGLASAGNAQQTMLWLQAAGACTGKGEAGGTYSASVASPWVQYGGAASQEKVNDVQALAQL
jgi:hypothetical protein